MKKYGFFLFTILLSACVNNTPANIEVASTSTEDVAQQTDPTPTYIIANIVDSVIAANPDYLNNDIKRKKVGGQIQSAILTAVNKDHNVLTEIPLTFKQMMQKGNNKYIVKFELTNIGSSGTRISDKYDIYFNVFTEMTEEEASELIQNQNYNLTFSSISDVSNNLVLPSGCTFIDTPNVYKTSLDDRPSVSSGGFLLKGVKFKK